VLVIVINVEVSGISLERLELLYPLLEWDLGNGVREACAAGPTAVLWTLELEAYGPELRDALGVELRGRSFFECCINFSHGSGDDANDEYQRLLNDRHYDRTRKSSNDHKAYLCIRYAGG